MDATQDSADRLPPAAAGFTLIEVIVVVAVLALLAGLILPSVTGVTDDAKAGKVLTVTDTLKKAVDLHYAHTSTLAIESSASTSVAQRELSTAQTTPGWKGPYLDHPVGKSDNPFGGDIVVYDSFTSGGTSAPGGFDLLGSGADTATGAGQYVMIHDVPDATAQAVDSALDRGIAGDWKVTGRVEYDATALRLNIFLLDR